MKGTYKIYDRDAKTWVELPLYFKGDSVKLKIENKHLVVSYDEENTWEDIGEINTGVDKAYVDENFAKKNEVVINKSDDGGTIILDDEGVTIASGNEEQMIGYLGVSNDSSTLVSMNYADGIFSESMAAVSSGGAVLMSASQDELGESHNGSTILASPNQISLQHTNDDTTNTVTLDSDGFKYNNLPVITSENIDSLNIIKVDENGIANKNEITIGAFEIKNDKPYNYTLEGHYEPYDWPGGSDEREHDATFTAEYNREGAKLYRDEFNAVDYWAYEFVVTKAKIYVDEPESGGEAGWQDWNDVVDRIFPIDAAYLDNDYTHDDITPLVFTNDVADSPTLYFNNNEDKVYDAKFIRTAPFSLKTSSKVLLNGVQVTTIDDIREIVASIEDTFTIIKGDADNSAVLEGKYQGYSNKAISQVSMAVGAASTAGLKGWYYTNIELDESNNTHIITLSDTQPTVNNGKLVGTWTSGTVNVKSGDKISIVNNSKFDFCGEVTGYKNNKIRVKGLQFDAIEIPETISRDDFSIYLPEKPDAGIIDFGHGAFSQGVNTKSSNLASHAEGSGTHAYGQYSHTEGRETKAGYGAHAEGRETVASGNQSHAEGKSTIASGSSAHTEGYETEASGIASHAEGRGTTASADYSHAEGYYTTAAGAYSHTSGARTNTTNDYEFACGVYNNSTKDKTLFSVGNGSKKEGVHNAFEITVDGKIYINDKNGTKLCLQELLGIWE